MEVLPFILLAAMGFAFLVNVMTKLKARSLENTPAPEFLDVLGEDAARHRRVMIYFYSDHCPPCTRVSPLIDTLRETHPNVYKVNAARNSELAWRFKISGTPTVVVVQNGMLCHMLVGAVSMKKLQQALEPDTDAATVHS
ncbi:MAG: thioredoxin family protein [Gammaproteobacteria bacterium]|nr:thioredoxin family protein [Gammaproteobacteria bacterium]